jgi:hypothetical protein
MKCIFITFCENHLVQKFKGRQTQRGWWACKLTFCIEKGKRANKKKMGKIARTQKRTMKNDR